MSRLLIWCVDSFIPWNEKNLYATRRSNRLFGVLFAVWHRSATSTLPLDAFHLYSVSIGPFKDPELKRMAAKSR